jgi:hypothetical protein
MKNVNYGNAKAFLLIDINTCMKYIYKYFYKNLKSFKNTYDKPILRQIYYLCTLNFKSLFLSITVTKLVELVKLRLFMQ